MSTGCGAWCSLQKAAKWLHLFLFVQVSRLACHPSLVNPRLLLVSEPGSMVLIDLFTDTAAISNKIHLRSIIGYPGYPGGGGA